MSAAPARLLVVDDNEMNLDMLSRRLERRGFAVDRASDGAQALQMIATTRYDLVLLDVMMPGIDGLEVLTRVRSLFTASMLPVIIATSKDKSEDVVRALQLGANDYVVKPLDFAVLLARIEAHLRLKRTAGLPAPDPGQPVDASRTNGQPSRSQPTPCAGSRLGRFVIEECIGEGGMGQVFLARDPQLLRLVAIKTLRKDLTSDAQRERFAREGRAAARLSHQNIVTIYDVGDEDGFPFIAMEFVPGESLAQKVQQASPLVMSQKFRIAEQLCAGVAHAHQAGLIHRDIKPANVMITPAGDAKILDFGIARHRDEHLTQTGVVLGSLNYMAPEQLCGRDIDHRVDLFAMGAVLYELFSYRRAFPGQLDDGVLSRILHDAPVPLREVSPTIDARLATVIERALSKSPAERPASAEIMRRQIAGLHRVLYSDEAETGPP